MKKENKKRRALVACFLAVLLMGLALWSGCGAQEGAGSTDVPSVPDASQDEKGSKTPAPSPEQEPIPSSSGQTEDGSSKTEQDLPVKIGCGQSQLLALSYAGLEKEQVTKLWSTLQKYEGKIIHEVTFVCEGFFYTYRIDAKTGENLGFTRQEMEAGA